MKKIINRKKYDTSTAFCLGTAESREHGFRYWREELYKKHSGEFFLYGTGGPMTAYRESSGENSWTGGEAIIPYTAEEARAWAEKRLTADEYEEIFGPVEE